MSDNTSERFSDPLDQAAPLADLHNTRGVGPIRSKAAPEQTQNKDGTYPITECTDCGDTLSPARLKTGRIRCVPCVEFEEEANKRAGRR